MSNRYASLSLELTTAVDDERPVFVSGNFCEWYPDIAHFRMQKIGSEANITFSFLPIFVLTNLLNINIRVVAGIR